MRQEASVISGSILREVFREAWAALRRSRTRSILTMLGIVWGIAAVTLLVAYGNGFRTILVSAFNAFGKSTVVAWCSMSKKSWLQPAGEIGNPYYGKEMPRCGEVVGK